MKPSEPLLTAVWPDGRQVEPGADAIAFLISSAEQIDEDPDALLRLVRSNSSAARIALKLLGLTQEALTSAPRPPGRPNDRDKQELILLVVSSLIEDGHPRPDAYAKAAHLLADPMARAKVGLGASKRAVRGNGHFTKAMSAKSVENAYRKAREAAVHWYFEVIDDHSSASTNQQASSRRPS